ncbi:GAF domain-containing protein [Dactylosporangium sp. NPDC048998]|uniref:GAF domain-containing protein n=1 Tax=Dactylosporangium sp. NPDC048998 TaxID=3363976 RepID=UPI003715F9E2
MIDVLGTVTAVHDAARLHAVAATGLGAAPHPWFDHVVAYARRVLGVPIALVVLVERTRQILPGSAGLPEPWQHRRETPLTHSICQYVVGARTRLAIDDVRRDPVLHSSDAIRDLGVTAFAGVPVRGRGGHVLGALSAIDSRPRVWTAQELATLDRIAARCDRKLLALSVGPAPSEPAPGHRAVPAARCPSSTPVTRGDLWTPRRLPAGATLDRRLPLRTDGADAVLSGRWKGESVAVIIRTADDPPAVRRFRRRREVAQAFRRTPPLVLADEHRWHDDRTLVVSRAVGEPLQAGPDDPPVTDRARWARLIQAAALLSTWRPAPEEVDAWTVDYDAWIARHERGGHLSAGDVRRLRDLLDRCRADRTFAHGNLTPRSVLQLPSGRLALTDFADAGLYLAGFDLAALLLAAPDAQVGRDIDDRVHDADIAEPFLVNLMLRTADEAATAPAPTTTPGLARRRAALVGARRHIHLLLARLAGL